MNPLEALLSETPSHPPCGEDLSYDADFLALETAAQGKPEQQFGDTVIASEPPDWRDVENRAEELLARTKDLRVASFLCRAKTSLHGIVGAADTLELIAGLMEAYWPSLHPLPEDDDYFMRLNALAFLDDPSGFLLQLRQTPLIRTAAGVVLIRDAEALTKGLTLSTGPTLSNEQIRIGVAKAWAEGDDGLLAISRIESAIFRIADECAKQLPQNQRPGVEAIKTLMHAVAEILPSQNSINGTSQAGLASGGTPQASGVPGTGPAQLRTRADASAQLLLIAEFLETSEPTNPAPLLIRRAIRLMQMGFVEIMRELSPDSIAQIENITGTKSDN